LAFVVGFLLLPPGIALGQQTAAEPDAYLKKGLEAYSRGDFDAAIREWTDGLRVAEAQQDDLFVGTFQGNLGLAYSGRGEHAKAIDSLEKAVGIARRIQDRKGLGSRLNNLGGLYLVESKAPTAVHALEEALRIAQDLDDPELAANIRNNLGQAYLLTGENLKAVSALRAASAHALEKKDLSGQAEAASHLGAAYAAIGNYGQALNHLRLSLSLSAKDASRLRIRTYQRMAALTRDLGDLAAAYTFQKAAAAEAQQAGSGDERAKNEALAAEIASLDDGTPATRERLRKEGLARMRDRLRAHGFDGMAREVEAKIKE
jgi:tetratricopeptide (TPR) repeat protein